MRISVALAAYCGEKYIEEQLHSILCQLPEDGEIVVSLDPSTDRTFEILSGISSEDRRLRVIDGPGKGLIANFENAVSACRGDIIFLSDQDDVWLPEKVKLMCTAFDDPDVTAVIHDASVTDGELNVISESFFSVHGRKEGTFNNWLKNSYIGCCMAFRREIIPAILPFPDKLPMHDQWIGIIGEQIGRTVFIDKPLILWRRHGDNSSSTSHAGVSQMIKWRASLALALLKRRKEVARVRQERAGSKNEN